MKQLDSGLYVIVGLGATGLSCATFLSAQGVAFAMMDTRPNPPQLAAFQAMYPDAPVVLGGLDAEWLSKAKTIVLSPGIALREPVIASQIQKGVPVIGDIELFAQFARAPVIAITGTNAKSTVTTLVGMMMERAGYRVGLGGNLGIPALDLITPGAEPDVYVLELSSFQLETTYSLVPAVSTVLNITPDHMDRYDTVADYAAAKHRIYIHSNVAVSNRDDPATETYDASVKRKLYFTLQSPKENEFGLREQDGVFYLAHGETNVLSVKELPVPGRHYQANALAAMAIGYGFGLAFEPMVQVLREFKGLPHRCQLVRELNRVRWYNDSKGTNVGATQAAIEGLGGDIDGRLVLIAGGVGKNADFTSLLPAIEKYVRHVVLIGEAANELAQMIGNRVPVSHADSMEAAVQLSAKAAKPSDCVLLSPACASFDMFNNYEHRGDVFTAIVEKLM